MLQKLRKKVSDFRMLAPVAVLTATPAFAALDSNISATVSANAVHSDPVFISVVGVVILTVISVTAIGVIIKLIRKAR